MSERMNSMRWLVRPACLLRLPFLILNFAPFAYSEERPSNFLEDLTWTELRNEIGSGKTTIIIPIGGTEQNGPAVALGKHNRRVKLLCERICSLVGRRACRRQFKSAVWLHAFPWNDKRAGSRV
jgi:hypothetical protein